MRVAPQIPIVSALYSNDLFFIGKPFLTYNRNYALFLEKTQAQFCYILNFVF